MTLYTYMEYIQYIGIYHIYIYIYAYTQCVYNIYIAYTSLGKLERPHCDLFGIMVSIGNHPLLWLQVSD